MKIDRNVSKPFAVIIFVAIILLAFSVISTTGVSSSSQKGAEGSPLTHIPGVIFQGDYLRIGINDAGTLGVTNMTSPQPLDPGVGFQSVSDIPFAFPSTESAAIWWWGEGYNIAYKELEKGKWVDTVAYWQPGYGYPPGTLTNIVPVSQKTIIDDEQKAVREIVVMTTDKKLQMTFTFTFLKQYPELNLETTIKNVGTDKVRDVVYKRIVDWDVCTDVLNDWASTGHEAYAWDQCLVNDETMMVQLTIAGHDGESERPHTSMPIVNYVDLWAWDDQTVRSPNDVIQSFVPIFGDNNAAIYYKIGELKQQESKTVYTVYQSNFPKIETGKPSPDIETISVPIDQNKPK